MEHLHEEQTTCLNPTFEGIWWQSSHQKNAFTCMVPAVRFLYLAFCVQGASTNGVDAKVFIELDMKPHGICVGVVKL